MRPGPDAVKARVTDAETDELDTSAAAPEQTSRSRLRAFRVTTENDILRLKPLVIESHAESRYGHIPFSDEKYLNSFLRVVRNPDAISIYNQYGDGPVGVLGAEVGEYFLGQGGRIATSHGLYVSNTTRHSLLGGRVGVRLLRLFTDWARQQGADEINIHANSGIDPERTDRLMRKLGFEVYGGNYVARVG